MRYVFYLLAGLLFSCAASAAENSLANLRSGHPRLLITGNGFADLRAAAATDPLRARLHARIIAVAEAQLSEPAIQHVLIGPRMLDQSRKAIGYVLTGAMAFQLTGDIRFADHARKVMATAAAFPDWNPDHFLDVAEMATALAIGYDWLYDQLTPAERVTIKGALLDKALVFARPAYARAYPDRESFPFVRGNLTNNWNQVCNGGFALAALALADEEPELAKEVIAGVRATLPVAMEAYQPSGAYPEGPVYWGYGTRFNILILAAFESALGTDFGLGALPAFDRTALFRVYVQSPTGLSFNYADGRPQMGMDCSLTWLGHRYGHPVATAVTRTSLGAAMDKNLTDRETDRFLALNAIWFPEAQDLTLSGFPSLDANFDGPSKLAVFRSAWNDSDALWTGLKAGSNRVNHGHLDLGSFMLDADGERWAVDLGPDNYNLPGYWESGNVTSPRWQYFRLNNRSHNTIIPGGALQLPQADAPMIGFASKPARAFGIADLSSAYPNYGARFLRGVALLDRSRVLVQDEIEKLKKNTPLVWQMATGAHVKLDGGQAILTQNGKTLRLEILEPATAIFSSKPATPPTAAEEQNRGVTLLRIEISADAARETDLQLAVLLSPVGKKWPELPIPALQPLSAWK